MSERMENIGQRESLRQVKKRLCAEIASHRDSLRAALPVLAEAHELDGEYVLTLAMSLRERLGELDGVEKKIAILNREIGN